MEFLVASVYHSEINEVYVDTFIEDTGSVVIPDSVIISLQNETRDQMGSVRYLTVDSIEIERDMATPDKHLVARFKNPTQKINLWVEVQFKLGTDTTVKKAFVGTPDAPQVVMDLPNNSQFQVELEDDEYFAPAGGGQTWLPENDIVLSPVLQNRVKEFDFTGTMSSEDFEGLNYVGGGSRLLTDLQTNKFVMQDVDVAPWDMKAFCFLEPANENLVDATLENWEVGSTTALIQSNLSLNTELSEDLNVLTLRVRQNRPEFNNTDISLKTKNKSDVLPNITYCFSSFIQITPKNKTTKVDKIKLVINWFDAQELQIKRDVTYISATQNMYLAHCTFMSPSSAAFASCEILVGSVDNGDDVEIKYFAPQMEVGALPTSRTISYREADSIQVLNLNLENFKLRTVFMPGFNHTEKAWQLVNGMMKVYFSTDTLKVEVGDETDSFYQTLDVPFQYNAFSEVDLTIEVKSGEFVKVYRNGLFLAQAVLTDFTAGYGALEVKGAGIELTKLLAFNWS